MINTRANLNLLAVSAALRETAINTPQNTSQTLLVSADNYLDVSPRRENNASDANGLEEPDIIYDNGKTATLPLTFDKLQPNQAAFMLAYGLGSVTSATAGTGKLHTIKPIDGDIDAERSNPTFTGVQRRAKTVEFLRSASMAVSSCSITFAADDWVKGAASCVGTGRTESTLTEVSITALDNVTSLTLPVAAAGTTAADRLDNVHQVRALYGGAWQWIKPTDSPTATTLTVPSLGGAGASVTYKVLYAQTLPAWTTMPARINESPLRVSQMCLTIGGAWNGTAFVGGVGLGASLGSFEWSLDNKISPVFTPCAGGAYAGQMLRGKREQKIKLSRELRSLLLANYMRNNEYFGLYVLCEGALYDATNKYTLEAIFPRLGVISDPLKSNKDRVSEDGELTVLQDATYGSSIFRIKNLVSGYAA
ncbi:hypothetical protein [Candidatus Electronema sp. JM]|uniref:hypothetical protein n=1 Tax=Candidatus Electronema sp. JM TaxID=3401571 RepID=UPI003AA8CE22